MKSKYKREAYLIDDGVITPGYTAKKVFYVKEGIQCGFNSQKFKKRDVGKTVFYGLNLKPVYPNQTLDIGKRKEGQ